MRVSMVVAGAAALLLGGQAGAALADHDQPKRHGTADDVVLVGAVEGFSSGTGVNGTTVEARAVRYTATAAGGFNGAGLFTIEVNHEGDVALYRGTGRSCSERTVIEPGDVVTISAEPGSVVAAGSSYRCGSPV